MHTRFPLFSSHLELAAQHWQELLQPGDTAIDATCGNGKDTLKLARMLCSFTPRGTLFALDIQGEAIVKTRLLLESQLTREDWEQVTLYKQSHAQFPALALEKPIRLIVYNLGYLPGSNKKVKTQKTSTLQSVATALDLIVPGGAVSVTCYPGHPEGAEEQESLLEWASQLSSQHWNVCHHQWPNARLSPTLLLFQKKE